MRRWCILGLVTACLSLPVTTFAQDSDHSDEAQLLEDFIHYVLIAQVDLAHGSGQALLDSNIEDAVLYELVDDLDIDDRLTDSLLRAMRIDALEDIAGQIETRLRSGRRDLARDPDEIERHIHNLMESARAKQMAIEALLTAGEYAVPQLLDVVTGNARPGLKAECRLIIERIGRQAAMPLAISLPELNPVAQEVVCEILGEIDYSRALPALYELAVDPDTKPVVQKAALKAYSRIGGLEGIAIKDLWMALAERYWAESESLIAWPSETVNNVWKYLPGQGLTASAVPSEIFGEVMAMQCCLRALNADPNSIDASALWIASNFRRQDQLGDGVDPTYGANMRRAMFYAVMAGPETDQRILSRANDDLNSILARHAIAALKSTAGGASLWSTANRRTPLVESLEFPERRVRFDAAQALGQALPMNAFDGSDRVVPTLVAAINAGAERYAAVLAQDDEDRRSIASSLRSMGFTVLPARRSFEDLRPDLAESSGVDLFVVRLPSTEIAPMLTSVQADTRVAATPVMVIAALGELDELTEIADRDHRVGIMRLGITEQQKEQAILGLVHASMGELMTDEEAENYAATSLRILRDMAVRHSDAFDVTPAEGALIKAIDRFSGDLRLVAAETLSWIGTPEAQNALLDAALSESDEMIQVILFDYTSGSARRFGSYANDRQIRRLLTLVRTTSGPAATAAARVHGALDLPASNMVEFIIDE